MDTKELDTKPAGRYALAAYLDARMKNAVNSTHYTQKQRTQAEGMRYALELVRSGDIHINYRQKFIAIKAAGHAIKDRKNLLLLEQEWADKGVEILNTPQGTIYRIKNQGAQA